MDHEACLACARTGLQKCGYDYVVLRALYENHEERPDIHVTDLTGCLRKAWYSKTTRVAETPHSKYALMVGSIMHGGLEGSDEYMDAELPFNEDGIVGRADVVYKDGRLLDLKTTRWLYPSKMPYGSHALQVNMYAYFLKKSGGGKPPSDPVPRYVRPHQMPQVQGAGDHGRGRIQMPEL